MALVAGAAIMLGAAQATGNYELAAPPLRTMDECLCGGYISYSFYARYERGAFDECWYQGRSANGTVVNYIVYMVPSSQGC